MENINLVAFGTAFRRLSSSQVAVVARLESAPFTGSTAGLARECDVSDSSAFRAQLDALFDAGVLRVSYKQNKTHRPALCFALAQDWAKALTLVKTGQWASGAFTFKSPTGDLCEAENIPDFLRAHVEEFPNQKSAEVMFRTKGRAYGWEIVR